MATIEWLREFPNAGPLPQLWHTLAIAMEDGSRIEVAPSLNGPTDSGQGGYSCGLVAGLTGNPAQVTLRSPVPLDTPLPVERPDDGTVVVRDGETVVAEGRPAELGDLEVPDPPRVEEAREASQGYESKMEAFVHCFVCGPRRPDGQRVFAAQVGDRPLVATHLDAGDDWLAGEGGMVRPEFVWAVLDCPTYFASALERPGLLALLGRLTAELISPGADGRAARRDGLAARHRWPQAHRRQRRRLGGGRDPRPRPQHSHRGQRNSVASSAIRITVSAAPRP